MLGCDSVASTSKPFLDPMSLTWELDANGVPLQEDGKYTLKFRHLGPPAWRRNHRPLRE